jgi:hypothetical protein
MNDIKFPIRLDSQDLFALSRAYMNKNDLGTMFFEKIQSIDGFEDFLIHANDDYFVYETVGGEEIRYTASEFADILKKDRTYHGGNIRLLACGSGRATDGLAQQLANELQCSILAPTETLWIREDGALFISDNQVLAEMWEEHITVFETGEWKLFRPRKEE